MIVTQCREKLMLVGKFIPKLVVRILKNFLVLWPVWLSWLGVVLQTEGPWWDSQSAPSWVVGRSLFGVHTRRQPVGVSPSQWCLSLSLPPFPSL